MATTARGTGEVGGATVEATPASPDQIERARRKVEQAVRELAFANDEVLRLTVKVDKQRAFADEAATALAESQARVPVAEQGLADAQARLAAMEG